MRGRTDMFLFLLSGLAAGCSAQRPTTRASETAWSEDPVLRLPYVQECLAKDASTLVMAESRICPECNASGIRTTGLTAGVFAMGVVSGDATAALAALMRVCIARDFAQDAREPGTKATAVLEDLRSSHNRGVNRILLGDSQYTDKDVAITVFKMGENCGSEVSLHDPDLRRQLVSSYMTMARIARETGAAFDEQAEAEARQKGSICVDKVSTWISKPSFEP